MYEHIKTLIRKATAANRAEDALKYAEAAQKISEAWSRLEYIKFELKCEDEVGIERTER